MSGTLDMVGVAMEDVRISLEDLTAQQRVDIFGKIAESVNRHYTREYKGGRSFVEWEKENYGERWTQYTIRREALILDRSLWPSREDYSHTTRIVSLTCDGYREGLKKKESPPDWKVGDIRLVFRLCATQDGKIFLEKYEGAVTGVEKEHPGIPTSIVVSKAAYYRLYHYRIEDDYENTVAMKELSTLLKHDPWVLFGFGSGILSLIDSEASERQMRADRDRKLFNELNGKLRHFGITHP